MKKTKKNYINNNDLMLALVEYNTKCKEAKEAGLEKPRVPHYIGLAIMNIASGLAMRPNFSGYSYIEDMKMDGIENCLNYMHNFDPSKTTNVFAYFTQIIWYAFLRRIEKEKKQLYVRYASSLDLLSSGDTYLGDDNINLQVDINYINDFVESYETRMKNKKTKKEVE